MVDCPTPARPGGQSQTIPQERTGQAGRGRPGGYAGRFEPAEVERFEPAEVERFEPAGVERFARHLVRVLDSAAADPDRPASSYLRPAVPVG